MIRHFFRAILMLAMLAGSIRAHANVDVSVCWEAKGIAQATIAACTQNIDAKAGGEAGLEISHINRAYAYMRIKAFNLGFKDCDAAVGLRPDDAHAYDCRGVMNGSLQQLDAAIADLSRALELDPRDDYALLSRALAFDLKNDFVAAAADYTNLIRLKPKSFAAWSSRCWDRAVIGKELDAALSDCDEALRLHPGDADSYNSRGFANFRKKQYREAIRDYDSAIASDASGYASSYYIRGLAKLATGNAMGAADIAKGKSLEPGIAKRYAGYGVSLAR